MNKPTKVAPDKRTSRLVHRVSRPDDPKLEALLDERAHIRVRISLIADDDMRKAEKLTALLGQLRDLDRQIETIEAAHRKARD